MLTWFLKLLGVSSDMTAHLADATWSLQRPVVFVLGVLLLIPIGWFIHRRHQVHMVALPPALQHVLTACRIAVLLILVSILAGPYLKLDLTIERRPIVALLVDHSRSMSLPAGPFDSDQSAASLAQAAGLTPDGVSDLTQTRQTLNAMTRAQLAHSVLQAQWGPLFGPLSERYDLRLFSLTDSARPVPISDTAPFQEPGEINGKRSAIGSAIGQVLEQSAGQEVAGLLVMTDGQNHGGISLAQAAVAATRASAPVFPVPIGSPSPLRDVAIADVFAPALVSVGDTVGVSLTIESHGFDGQTVRVELVERDTTLQAKDLTLRGAEQQQIELAFQASEPGAHYLTVRIAPLADEPVRENNQDVAFVRVDDQKMKVLYIEGLPRWDFRFVKNGMQRDHGLEPVVIVEPELKAGAAKVSIPRTADDWAEYRTVILGDCSSELLASQSIDSLAEAVRDQGLGVIVLAGPNHMPHGYEGTALVDLLPVRVRRNTAGYDAAAYNPFRLEITAAGALHEAMRLHDEPSRNAVLWSQMPPYHWCAAVVRPAPGATVLAANPSVQDRFGKLPLIAYHYAGNGKVIFIGTDSTWLWRQNVGDRYFYKFWGQTVRFAARRDDDAGKKSWIEVRPLRVQPGDPAEIELRSFGSDGTPNHERSQAVTIMNPDGQLETVDLDGTGDGRFLGRFTPATEGEYRIVMQTQSDERVEAALHVEYAGEELRRTSLNRPALESLATQSGGRVVELGELDKLPALLRGESRQIELHREETIWDNWFTAVLLALIYCTDVGIRRFTGQS